jgi:hypothetical protein
MSTRAFGIIASALLVTACGGVNTLAQKTVHPTNVLGRDNPQVMTIP